MRTGEKLTNALVNIDNPRSVAARTRRLRWEKFTKTFPDVELMNVLDLGGFPGFWQRVARKPAAVTVVNLDQAPPHAEPWIRTIVSDALDLPVSLRRQHFDLVFSNSLIEHVGGPAGRMRCAEVVHEMGDAHWVQTPYRYFPIEPHWLFPGMQFLPLAARATITQRWPLGHIHEAERQHAVMAANSVELVTITEMRALYPESTILFERFGGLVKSITAVKPERTVAGQANADKV